MKKSEALLGLLLLLLAGCDDQVALRWELRFSSNSDQEATVVIETDILEGGCSGIPRGAPFRLYTNAPGELPGEVLEPMRYGFRARAFDSDCTLIAAGCEAVTLPGPEEVVTLLTPVEDGPTCPPERCSRGVCNGDLPDGGPGDADIEGPDADAPDSDIDAGADADSDPDVAVDADSEPRLLTCSYRADSGGEQTLHCRSVDSNPDCSIWPRCSEVALPEYFVPDLPPSADIVSATLRYDCEDCDHPGAEGVVRFNGTPYPMPASVDWTDVWIDDIAIDVTPNVTAGRNRVVFTPAETDCTHYLVRRVEILVEAWLLRCP